MKYIYIKNWENFQHYKDRKPHWIKVYLYILDKYDEDGNPKKYYPLPDSAKLTLLHLLCLRARFNKHIPYENDKELAEMLGITTVNLQPLVNAGFITIDTEVIQDGTESLALETETEKEKETEIERPSPDGDPPPKKTNHYSAHVKTHLDIINTSCEKILKLAKQNYKKFNPYGFVQVQVNKQQHPGAICEVMELMVESWPEIKNPTSWGTAMMKIRNGNWHEKDGLKEGDAVEGEWGELVLLLKKARGRI